MGVKKNETMSKNNELGFHRGWNYLTQTEHKDGRKYVVCVYYMPFTKIDEQEREWNKKPGSPVMKLKFSDDPNPSKYRDKPYRSCTVEFIGMHRMPKVGIRSSYGKNIIPYEEMDLSFCLKWAKEIFVRHLNYLIDRINEK